MPVVHAKYVRQPDLGRMQRATFELATDGPTLTLIESIGHYPWYAGGPEDDGERPSICCAGAVVAVRTVMS